MRANSPGWETSRHGHDNSWRVGAAVEGGWVKKPGSWGTPFSGFRFAVPELCDFKGTAIYLDADMLVLGDIAELWQARPEPGKGIRAISEIRTDVSVIDCEWFGNQASNGQWPPIARMKPSGFRVFEYLQWLRNNQAIDTSMSKAWNDCDGLLYEAHPDEVKLIHYTNVLCGQPYRPYPNVDYSKFEWPYVANGCSVSAAKLWWKCYQEMLLETHDEDWVRSKLTANGGVWQ